VQSDSFPTRGQRDFLGPHTVIIYQGRTAETYVQFLVRSDQETPAQQSITFGLASIEDKLTTGFLTVTELINLKVLADKAKLDTTRITDLIKSDLSSPLKSRMSQGVNYYNSRHDIQDFRHYYWVDGARQEDTTKSNNKVPHPFHKILADQKTAYIVGNPVVVSIGSVDVVDEDNPTSGEQRQLAIAEEFQTKLMEKLGESFDDVLNDWILGASNKAIEWVHFYIDGKGDFRFMIVPSEQIMPVYDTQYQNDLIYVIRFYVYDLVDHNGQRQQRYKVEWWTKDEVEYWVQLADGMFIHDPDYELNPAPHWLSFNTLTPSVKSPNSWGRVPFVALWNNSQLHTDLQPIKPLIDAYDKVKSGWVNDLDDFTEQVYVLKGFTGLSGEAQAGLSELQLFMQNLKANRAIAVETDGAVTTLKADIPLEAKVKFLDITRREIFYFGEGVDVDNDKFGNNPSGISLKFLYASLDLKANRLIRKLKVALKEFMWFVTEWINRMGATKYDSSQIMFTVNKAMIFNEKEKIDGLLASRDMLSEQTILENHPYVDDVDEEMARLEAEKAEKPLASGELGKLPLAIQQLALARTRAEDSGDTKLSKQIGDKIDQLLSVMNTPTNGVLEPA
jgi:SPP1 family phage portal protein